MQVPQVLAEKVHQQWQAHLVEVVEVRLVEVPVLGVAWHCVLAVDM